MEPDCSCSADHLISDEHSPPVPSFCVSHASASPMSVSSSEAEPTAISTSILELMQPSSQPLGSLKRSLSPSSASVPAAGVAPPVSGDPALPTSKRPCSAALTLNDSVLTPAQRPSGSRAPLASPISDPPSPLVVIIEPISGPGPTPKFFF